MWRENGDENFPALFLRVTLRGKEMIQCFVCNRWLLHPSHPMMWHRRTMIFFFFFFFANFGRAQIQTLILPNFIRKLLQSSLFFFFLGSKRRVLITFIFYFKLFLNGKFFTIFYLKLKLSKCYI